MAFETTINQYLFMPNLKIISNLDCALFIDGDLIQEVKANVITKIPLDIGEYYVEAVSLINKDISLRRVVFLEYEKIFKIDLLASLMSNQKVREELDLIPKADELGFWGYVIKGSEIELIPYQFEEAQEFKDGFAIVKKGGWGVINKQEEVILDFEYERIDMFSRYLEDSSQEYSGFTVYKDGKSGFVGLDGQSIIPCEWEECIPSCDFIYCRGGKHLGDCLYSYEGIRVLSAKEIKPLYFVSSPPYMVINENGCGILDNNLKELVPIKFYQHREYDSESEDDIFMGVYSRQDRSITYSFYEYFDNTGFSWVLPYFDRDPSDVVRVRKHEVSVYAFYHIYNYPVVVVESTLEQFTPNLKTYQESGLDSDLVAKKETLDSVVELITREGIRKTLWRVEEIGVFYNERARIRHKDKWSYVDCNGNYLFDFKYDKVFDFNGREAVVHNEKGYGLIDHNGKEIIPCQYNKIFDGSDASIPVNCIIVQDFNGDEGVYDRDGNIVVQIKRGQRISLDKDGNIITRIEK